MPEFIRLSQYSFLVSLLLIWSLFWKGLALWQAANRRHLTWYLLILVINSLGILEIAYIFYLHRFDLKSTELLKFIHLHFPKKK
ncbi:hypothetical protein A2W24_01305 [Microgenomates group bacterium RBG_16_45_19]|nr:MAG: hypothetical protein A2W24_01305 [Microgenomates group bacterium RBG_16_45_19]